MNLIERVSSRSLLVTVALIGVVATYLVFTGGSAMRTVTAHFDRTVAVYQGTELRVMGVRIGEVTAVVPEGNSVRVEMEYDPQYSLPADAKAAIVTPTLVADRFVQVFPAYAGGKKMAPGADIPLNRTQAPVELDRMYKSLSDLSRALGPESGSGSGPLNNLLSAGADALAGNGAMGGEAIRNLSAAAETFNNNKGPFFANVRQLASITDTLAANDQVVSAFIRDLASVSGQLSGERKELRKVLASLARVLGTVKGFVKDNRQLLTNDVRRLTRVVGTIEEEKDSVGLVVQKGALAMGNLALAYDPVTGTFGSRVQLAPAFERPDILVCEILKANGADDSVCQLITNLLGPITGGFGAAGNPTGNRTGNTGKQAQPQKPLPAAPTRPELSELPSILGFGASSANSNTPSLGLAGLLGGSR